jgi:hypothetical protein
MLLKREVALLCLAADLERYPHKVGALLGARVPNATDARSYLPVVSREFPSRDVLMIELTERLMGGRSVPKEGRLIGVGKEASFTPKSTGGHRVTLHLQDDIRLWRVLHDDEE